jgi:hypothetical protein
VTFAVTVMLGSATPAFARRAAKAIEKQLACAAASSSSGLVAPALPVPSVRSAQLVAALRNAPLFTDTPPVPPLRSPRQVAVASCVVGIAVLRASDGDRG